jgi:type III secretion system YscQ/HrcQ family protein
VKDKQVEDPYLDQLESSMEDLNHEEATRLDVSSPSAPSATKAPTIEVPQDVASPSAVAPAADFTRVSPDIPVHLVAVLGKRSVTVKDILKMKMGEVVELDRAPHDVVDLVANGKLVAQGELVEIDGKLGVRILKLI